MSQIFKTVASSPSVPTSFVLDTGTAVPLVNVMEVKGAVGSGITTTLGASNQILINVGSNNFVSGSITTSDGLGQTQNLLVVPLLGNAGVFTFQLKIVAYCTAGADIGQGNGYTVAAAVLTNGSAGTLLPNEAIDEFEQLVAATISMMVVGNNGILQVNGIAGDTINWRVQGDYIYRGVA